MQQAHLTVIVVGSDKFEWIEAGLAHYETLLKRYARLTHVIVPSPKKISTDQVTSQKSEADLLRPILARHEPYIALADSGSQCTSVAMSAWLTKTLSTTGGKLGFVIGGPYGLAPEIISGARGTLSLSPMTFSHQLVRLVLLEQLFRAFSIAAGDPYHR